MRMLMQLINIDRVKMNFKNSYIDDFKKSMLELF